MLPPPPHSEIFMMGIFSAILLLGSEFFLDRHPPPVHILAMLCNILLLMRLSVPPLDTRSIRSTACCMLYWPKNFPPNNWVGYVPIHNYCLHSAATLHWCFATLHHQKWLLIAVIMVSICTELFYNEENLWSIKDQLIKFQFGWILILFLLSSIELLKLKKT